MFWILYPLVIVLDFLIIKQIYIQHVYIMYRYIHVHIHVHCVHVYPILVQWSILQTFILKPPSYKLDHLNWSKVQILCITGVLYPGNTQYLHFGHPGTAFLRPFDLWPHFQVPLGGLKREGPLHYQYDNNNVQVLYSVFLYRYICTLK